MISEKKLSTASRNALKTSSFALPGRRYPIPDKSHARNALSRVSANGSPSEKSKVRAAVHRKFPGIGESLAAAAVVVRLLECEDCIPVYIDYEGPNGKSTMAADLPIADYEQMNVGHNLASLWDDLKAWAAQRLGNPEANIINVRRANEPHEQPEVGVPDEEAQPY